MKKFRLLLLDANVVIEISRHALWDQLVDRYEIHLARTVIDEAQFFDDDDGNRQYIDLTAYIDAKNITVFDLAPSNLAALRAKFDHVYFEKLDPGETESLGYLLQQSDECRMCSADKIVYRVLGNLSRAEQGISLEEVLNQVGLGRRLDREFTQGFREEWTRKGFQEGLSGIGMKATS